MENVKTIKDLFTGYDFKAPTSGRRSERGDLLDYFTGKINQCRVGTPYKPVKVSYVAFRVGHLKRLEDLYYLKSLCDSEERRGESWSKIFFGSIKPR